MLSVLSWQGLTWDLFYSVFEFVGNEKAEQTSVICLDLKRVSEPFRQKVKQNQLTSKTEGSFACLSTSFLYVFQRPVTRKSTTIHPCSLVWIPFSLGSTTCSWSRFPLPTADLLPYISSLPLPGKYSNTLKMLGLCGQEKGEPGILDMVMSPCSV